MSFEWLSLSGAAKILGVHPSTVRSWSNQGFLPVHRTQGGHRRYLRSEVDLWMQSQSANSNIDGKIEVNQVVQNALRKTRLKINEGRLKNEAWYNKLDDEARDQYRESGHMLLQGLINFINSGSDSSSETEALGCEYASRGRRYSLNSVEATQAFLFFRNLLIESLLNVYEAAAIPAPKAWSDMLNRINQFTDQILITLLETYETYQRVPR